MAFAEILIDHALEYFDNMSTDDAYASGLKNRMASYLTQVLCDIRDHREWPFLQTNATVTFTVNTATKALPTGYWKLGGHGSCYNMSTGCYLDEVNPSDILELNQEGTYDAGVFAIQGSDLLVCTVSAATSFKLNYLAGGISTPLTYNEAKTTVIPYIPERYHLDVVLYGLILKVMTVKSDKRPWAAQYLQALDRMVAAERPRSSTTHTIALARGGMC